MEENMQFLMASSHKNNKKIQLLRLLEQPDFDSSQFELEESDVIWSSELGDSLNQNSPVMSPVSNSQTNRRHSYRPEKFGLSAVFANDYLPPVRRKAALNPSAARIIPPVSESNSDDVFLSSPRKFHQSAPVNVPIWPKGNGTLESKKWEFFEDDDMEIEKMMIPPHEIVARSHATTFSVFEGVGRTLKGRDLRRVRNAIWQKTGFLD